MTKMEQIGKIIKIKYKNSKAFADKFRKKYGRKSKEEFYNWLLR